MQDLEFEICVFDSQGCALAEQYGATRVELCAALTEGGTTPSLGQLRQARAICKQTKLYSMIRPRGGDFAYSASERAVMEDDIKAALDVGVDGLVFGCLTTEGSVALDEMAHLLDLCQGTPVTFHRAFDVVKDKSQALEDIIALKRVERILTSGGEASAYEGRFVLKQLHAQAQGRIHLQAAAGVNAETIGALIRDSGLHQYHFSAKGVRPSAMQYRQEKVFMGLPSLDEYDIPATKAEKIEETMKCARRSFSGEILS